MPGENIRKQWLFCKFETCLSHWLPTIGTCPGTWSGPHQTRKQFFLLLVSHLRLSQWKDETVEGWLKPFYCHDTLPETAYQLFLTTYFKNTYFDQKWSDFFIFLLKQVPGPLFVTFITVFANFSHFKPPKTIKDCIFKILFMKKQLVPSAAGLPV